MKITEFFNTDYVDYASYDNLRKIASVMDGQKNTSRKILYTVLEKNIKTEVKVSQLSAKMAEFAEYLHGDASGVIVTMAQDYAGTNNLPLLTTGGNFGNRMSPDASAPRYIYTAGTKHTWDIFNKDDNAILNNQIFEGEKIEPMFYIPSLPLILINGAEGVSSGFSQKILPRNPKDIEDYVKSSLKGKNKPFRAKPYFNGFKGVVEQGDNSNQWKIKGLVQRIKVNKVQIDEVPVGVSLKAFIKTLDKLEDNGKIRSYVDYSDPKKKIFKFEVTMDSKVLKLLSDEALLKYLGLVKTVSELYNVMSEDNKILSLTSVDDIMQYYLSVKLKFMTKRKAYLQTKIGEDIRLLVSKYLFIKAVTEDTLIISKRKKADIVKDLEGFDKIIKSEGNYDYLLNMSIASLTEERMAKLMSDIKEKKSELDFVRSSTLEEMWLKDLD